MAIAGNLRVVLGHNPRNAVEVERESMAQVVETREILENENLTEL